MLMFNLKKPRKMLMFNLKKPRKMLKKSRKTLLESDSFKSSGAAMKQNGKVTKLDAKASSPQIVASIVDLLIEILLRLPLKPLVCFKLVSKHWLSVISDEKFQFLWNQNPKPAAGLIFKIQKFKPRGVGTYIISFDKSSTNLITPLNFINSPCPLQIMDSCNGLLLCIESYRRGYSASYIRRYYVCNPTTNKYLLLPQPPQLAVDEDDECHQLWLAYDPSNSPHYKVVCITTTAILSEEELRRDQFHVYSSQTGCWRKCGKPFRAQVNFARGVYWNGAIHWISVTNARKSVFFNPDDDEKMLQAMPASPARSMGNSSMYYTGESCGHLHYIEDRKARMELRVYEMRRDYSEWFVKYKVGCWRVDDRLSSAVCALVRGKKDEDSFLVWRRGNRFVRHNLVGGDCETIYECEEAEKLRACSPLQLILSF